LITLTKYNYDRNCWIDNIYTRTECNWLVFLFFALFFYVCSFISANLVCSEVWKISCNALVSMYLQFSSWFGISTVCPAKVSDDYKIYSNILDFSNISLWTVLHKKYNELYTNTYVMLVYSMFQTMSYLIMYRHINFICMWS
jgi:hypothetical protein